jgi:tetratricopeptide (TPR) repeat protein
VLVIEDLHWIDAETRAIVDMIVEGLGSTHLMLLVSFRPEYRLDWGDEIECQQVSLESFGADDAAQFLDTLLGSDEGLNELKRLLIARSQGIPLYIEELVRVLKDSGAVREASGRYVLTKRVHEIEIPATIQAVIASRIDRLQVDLRDILQVSSVMGETFPETLLTEVAGMDQGILHGRLSELQDLGFLDQKQIVPDVEYVFKHALTREVAYDSMLRRRRQEIHAAVVNAIEARYGNRIDEHLERLAHHAERAGLPSQIVSYARRAGAKALDRSAYREAIAYFDQALAALDKLPEEHEQLEMGVDLRLSMRAALGATGNINRMHERLVEADALAQKLDDPKRLAAVKIAQTFAFNYLGRLDDAVAAGTKGLLIAKDLGDPALLIAGSYHLAQTNQWSGNLARVKELLSPHLERLTGPLHDQRIGTAGTTSVLWLGLLGAAEAYLGEFERALENMEAARAIADDLERPYDQAIANWYMGFALSHQGRQKGAIPVLEAAMKICIGAKITFLIPIVATSQGHAYALVGRLDEAGKMLDMAVDLSRRMGLTYGIAWSTCNLGFLTHMKEDYARAIELAREALALSVQHGHRGVEVTARRLLADALCQEDESGLAESRTAAEQALNDAEALELQPESGHCHMTLARVLDRSGDPEGAQSHAHAAKEIFDRVGMTSWSERAAAVSSP